jgi:PAS domain-containing protein
VSNMADVRGPDPPKAGMSLLDALRAHIALLTYQVRFTTAHTPALMEALAAELELSLGELHQIDQALRTATEEFGAPFESAFEGVCQVAQTGNLTRVNAAFAALLGYHSPAHLLGAAPTLARFLVQPAAPELIARVAGEGTVWQVPLRLARSDGELLELAADGHARRSVAGGFAGMNLIFSPGGDRVAGPPLG